MQLDVEQQIAEIVVFLRRIGLTVRLRALTGDTFLPGLAIRGGALVIDRSKLAYPGDLLHEAGHMAVMTAADRMRCEGEAGTDGGAEMAAIAWSYAAALEIGLEPAVVFHADGYKSGGSAILENFAAGRYIGVPLLQWFEITTERRNDTGRAVYPKMSRWLRE
jgi:hypothetical protein